MFADGTSWSMDVLVGKAQGGTPGVDNLWGGNGPDNLDGLAGNDIIYGGKGDDTLNGGEGDDRLNGDEGNDSLLGGAGADNLYGWADNDILLGGAGADYLYGGAGDDTLDGGTGNDTLQGDGGNDTYLFGRGDGQDSITYDNVVVAGKHNVLRFKAGVSASDVTVTQSGLSLVLAINGTSDKVWASHFFHENTPTNSWNPIQEVVFDDGTSWSMTALVAKTQGGAQGAGSQSSTSMYLSVKPETAVQGSTLNSHTQQLIDAMSSFAPPPGAQGSSFAGAYPQSVNPVFAVNGQA